MFKKIAYLGENTEKRSNLCSFNNCSKQIISIIKRKNIKNNDDFYCLNCLHSFSTKNKL